MNNKELLRYINIIKIYITRFIEEYKNTLTWSLKNNSTQLKLKYIDWIFKRNIEDSKQFIPLCKSNIHKTPEMPKLFAFYLPQFYETEINNENFGKGFMEWYNVTKSLPHYTGHNQPQLPIDVGFYNLDHTDIMYRQIELAKKYGIDGFCFYYYWFAGERLLEKPVDNFLADKNLNTQFCLMWANSPWSKEWGTGEVKKIIKPMVMPEELDNKFAEDLLKYFKDDRYIKIDNKPLFIIHRVRAEEVSRMLKFITTIKNTAIANGFDGVHLMGTNAGYLNGRLEDLNVDSIVEFGNQASPITTEVMDMQGRYVNPNFKGRVVDVKKALSKNLHLKSNDYKTFKCVYPGWDNSSRKAYRGAFVYHMTPDDYKKWLKDVICWTRKNLPQEEQIVFINAWNEWAEGAHLEPDQFYGYAYLQATKDILEEVGK